MKRVLLKYYKFKENLRDNYIGKLEPNFARRSNFVRQMFARSTTNADARSVCGS